ncbi:MAG: cupin domain-containing protein [Deltaproteobacteria bacterium]|nr:cupin domain-containing protein [Deltaproteobacteria bacterium]MBI4796705.1 cupin domain-containing protein [Deltaproteobacteria bacterium]
MAGVEFIDLSGEIKEDPRGFVFFPWQEGVKEPQDLLRTFHLISIAPGQVRGNHLHPGHREFLFNFQGTGVLTWEEPPGEVRERRLTGHRTLVRIPPGIAHALGNPGPEILLLMAWRERADGPGEPETIPRVLRPQD